MAYLNLTVIDKSLVSRHANQNVEAFHYAHYIQICLLIPNRFSFSKSDKD